MQEKQVLEVQTDFNLKLSTTEGSDNSVGDIWRDQITVSIQRWYITNLNLFPYSMKRPSSTCTSVKTKFKVIGENWPL